VDFCGFGLSEKSVGAGWPFQNGGPARRAGSRQQDEQRTYSSCLWRKAWACARRLIAALGLVFFGRLLGPTGPTVADQTRWLRAGGAG